MWLWDSKEFRDLFTGRASVWEIAKLVDLTHSQDGISIEIDTISRII